MQRLLFPSQATEFSGCYVSFHSITINLQLSSFSMRFSAQLYTLLHTSLVSLNQRPQSHLQVDMSIQQLQPQMSCEYIYSCYKFTGLELVTPRLRTISGTLLNCFYALGGIYLGFVAMWFRNYKVLLLVTYLPAFIVLSYTFLLPQSKLSTVHYFKPFDFDEIIKCVFFVYEMTFLDFALNFGVAHHTERSQERLL